MLLPYSVPPLLETSYKVAAFCSFNSTISIMEDFELG